MKRLLFLSLLFFFLTGNITLLQAKVITVNFSGEVTLIGGSFTSNFQRGDTFTASYTFDTTTPKDSWRVDDPNFGTYYGGLIELSIHFEKNGLKWTFGNGNTDSITLFNNIDQSTYLEDQISIISTNPIDVSTLEGNLPDGMEIGFFKKSLKPIFTTLLEGDDIPTSIPAFDNGYFHLMFHDKNSLQISFSPISVESEKNLVLTNTSPDATISAGSNTGVYGTSGANSITLESGAQAELLNFPGSNTITIEADSSIFTISRSGATVTFEGTDGTVLKMPATTISQSIVFDNGSLDLVINGGAVLLGEQEIGTTAVAVATTFQITIFNSPETDIKYLIIGESGEKVMIATKETSGTEAVDYIVLENGDGTSALLYMGENGFPEYMVSGDTLTTYDNYTSTTVDITIHNPDGTTTEHLGLSITDISANNAVSARQKSMSAKSAILPGMMTDEECHDITDDGRAEMVAAIGAAVTTAQLFTCLGAPGNPICIGGAMSALVIATQLLATNVGVDQQQLNNITEVTTPFNIGEGGVSLVTSLVEAGSTAAKVAQSANFVVGAGVAVATVWANSQRVCGKDCDCVKKCLGGRIWDGNDCVCAPGNKFNGEKCVLECTNGKQWDDASSKCVDICPDDYVWSTTENACVSICPEGMVMENSSCKQDCDEGWYWDSEYWACRQCPDGQCPCEDGMLGTDGRWVCYCPAENEEWSKSEMKCVKTTVETTLVGKWSVSYDQCEEETGEEYCTTRNLRPVEVIYLNGDGTCSGISTFAGTLDSLSSWSLSSPNHFQLTLPGITDIVYSGTLNSEGNQISGSYTFKNYIYYDFHMYDPYDCPDPSLPSVLKCSFTATKLP